MAAFITIQKHEEDTRHLSDLTNALALYLRREGGSVVGGRVHVTSKVTRRRCSTFLAQNTFEHDGHELCLGLTYTPDLETTEDAIAALFR